MAASPRGYSEADHVVREFHEALARSSDMAVAVAAIHALTTVIRRSRSTTMMGLEKDLKEAAARLQQCNPTAISLKAGCELFLRYTTRTSALEASNFDDAKRHLIERGRHFAETSKRARATIAEEGEKFIRPGFTVLCHGFSRVAIAVLRRAIACQRTFHVIVTEGRPDGTGSSMARILNELGIPTTVVLDSGVGYVMERYFFLHRSTVDIILHINSVIMLFQCLHLLHSTNSCFYYRVNMVLVGAEAVVESGGIINKLGTYTVALAAKAHGVPVYVAAESYKFARLFPLSQRDLPFESKPTDFGPLMPQATQVDVPSRDYTPPNYITLLFTDLGVLTPAAVSDELIQLYI